jgi:hypothetical protein
MRVVRPGAASATVRGSDGPQAVLQIGEYHAHDGTDADLLLGKLSLLMQRRPRA